MRTVPGVPTLSVDLGEGPFALATNRIKKSYGSVEALDDLNLMVPDGAVYVLVGPNGAGKTTLLKILQNLERGTQGSATVLGLDTVRHGPLVRAQVGYVPEGHRLGHPWMRVARLLEHCAAYYPTWDHAYAEKLVSHLEVARDRKCGQLSKGHARRVQIVLALAHRPTVLLLDEPTDGLDHVARDRMMELLTAHLADTPTTALISTHRVYEVEKLVDHVGIIRNGRLLGQLPLDQLHQRLRRYSADLPEGMKPTEWEMNGMVDMTPGLGREVECTVWGEQGRVVEELTGVGANVRASTHLSVDEAATALFSTSEAS